VSLSTPGTARAAINELLAKAGPGPVAVIRVTINDTRATLTWVDAKTDKTVTYEWLNGDVREFDSDVVNIGQATFDVNDFALDDVGALFAQAAAVSGSELEQELQINEYNESRVLMTVTTVPESTTVFFHPDGRMIAHLDFTTAVGIREGLRDLVTDSRMALAIGVNTSGLWMDVRIDAETIERRIRPEALPSYTTRRAQSSSLIPYSAEMIQPQVIADIWASLLVSGVPSVGPTTTTPPSGRGAPTGSTPASPTITGGATAPGAAPPLVPIEFTADTRDGQWPPKLHFSFDGRSPVYSLTGQFIPGA
jgi:hypothetical protein